MVTNYVIAKWCHLIGTLQWGLKIMPNQMYQKLQFFFVTKDCLQK